MLKTTTTCSETRRTTASGPIGRVGPFSLDWNDRGERTTRVSREDARNNDRNNDRNNTHHNCDNRHGRHNRRSNNYKVGRKRGGGTHETRF